MSYNKKVKLSASKYLKSLKYALHGILKIFDHEGNFRIELIAAFFSLSISFLLGISRTEFSIIFFCIGLILAIETVNGVVELLCDIVTKDYRKDIEYAKDAMAGAVLISAITTAGVGFLIWFPYIIEIISDI